MEKLFDSTLVPLLIKSVAFLALAFSLWPIARRQSAAFQSVFWRSAMLGLAVLGAFSLWVPLLNFELPAVAPAAPAGAATVLADGGWRELGSPAPRTETIATPMAATPSTAGAPASGQPWILYLWFGGCLLLVSLWLHSRWRLSRLSSGDAIPASWQRRLETCQEAIGLGRRTRLCFARDIRMPCAWGVLRPTVLLPTCATRWTAERQHMVLMHELAHLKRRDPLHDLIARACVMLFWMNPLVWLAFRQLRLSAERATDDEVIAGGCSPQPYARLLLQFAKESLGKRPPELATAAPMAQGSTVGLRIEKLLDASQCRVAPRRLQIATLMCALLALAAACGGVQSSRAQAEAAPPDKDTAEADQEAKVRAELLAEVDRRWNWEEGEGVERIQNKLRTIIVPNIEFDGASLTDAIKFLRHASVQHDKLEKDKPKRGVNFVIQQGVAAADDPPTLSLKLTNVPLEDAIRFTTELAGYQYKIGENAVIIVREPQDRGAMLTQTFRVPPTFIGQDGGAAPSAKRVLENAGIPFPAEASAAFIEASSTLVVRNTAANLDLVRVYVEDQLRRANQPLIHMRAQIFRLPKLTALELVERFDDEHDAAGAAAELRRLAEEGKAALLSAPLVSTLTGQQSVIGTGRELRSVEGYIEEAGKDVPVERTEFIGTKIEFTPHLDPDGRTITSKVRVEKSFGEPEIVKGTALAPVSGKLLPTETVNVDRGLIRTQTNLLDGQTRLLGTLSPTRGDQDSTEIVLMKVWLKKRGE